MINAKTLVSRLQRKDENGKTLNATGQIREMLSYIYENYRDNNHDKEKLKEVIYAGKQMVIDTIMKDQAKYNLDSQTFVPNQNGNSNETSNATLSYFINDPISTLSMAFKRNSQEVENHGGDAEDIARTKNLSDVIRSQEDNYLEFAENRNDIMNESIYLMKNINGSNVDKPIQAALNRAKGNIFERMLGKTSQEWKDFKASLEERQQGFTTREDVDSTAKAYLMHKIPGYNGEGLPKEEDIQRLSGTAKLRAQLCLNTLKANEDARSYEQKVQEVEGNAKTNAIIYATSPIQVQQQVQEESVSVEQSIENNQNQVVNNVPVQEEKEGAIENASVLEDSHPSFSEDNLDESLENSKDDIALEN